MYVYHICHAPLWQEKQSGAAHYFNVSRTQEVRYCPRCKVPIRAESLTPWPGHRNQPIHKQELSHQ